MTVEPWGWASTIAGGAILAVVLLDVFLTIIHPDFEGPLAKRAQRAVWTAVGPVARRAGRLRRAVLSLTGPLMIATTIFVWTASLVVGFALVAWPQLGAAFARGPGLGAADFAEALYWAGTTATTLGYGDVTPRTPALQALAVMAAASGFALLTSALAFTLGVLSGIADRNIFALEVDAATGGTGDGTQIVLRAVADEEASQLRDRLLALGRGLRNLQEKFHRFPMLAFYYRSRDPAYDPEPTFAAAAEAALAARLVARYPGWRLVRPAAEELDLALDRFMAVVARRHLAASLPRGLAEPAASAEDEAAVARVRTRVEAAFGARAPAGAASEDAELVRLAARTRVFLDGLDALTAWKTFRREDNPGAIGGRPAA